jgi:hypothetical protein
MFNCHLKTNKKMGRRDRNQFLLAKNFLKKKKNRQGKDYGTLAGKRLQ